MKATPTLLILAATILLGLAAAIYDEYASPRMIPVTPDPAATATSLPTKLETAPDFSFETLSGQKTSLADLRGKPVLLNFWATWCTPCRTEFPALTALTEHYQGKITLLALSSDTNRKAIDTFLASMPEDVQKRIKSPSILIAIDKDQVVTHDVFLTERYPETIILTADGKMARKIIGEIDWNGPEIKGFIDSLLKPAP